MTKKRVNQTDLTLRNLRAERRRNKLLKEIISEHGKRIYSLEQDVKMLTHIVDGLRKPRRSRSAKP